MNRKKFFLGNNTIDIIHNSGAITEKMTAEIKLNGNALVEVAAQYNEGFTFFDMQTLLPEYVYPYPDFESFVQSNVDAISMLSLDYSQESGYTGYEEFLLLLNAGRSQAKSHGMDYSLRDPIPFLTNQPNFKTSTKFTPQWYFLPLNFHTETPRELHLIATALNEAGTITTVVLHTINVVNTNIVLGIDVSPYRVLDLLPNDTVAYYFQVYDENNDVVSEARYIRIIADNEEDFTMVYRNSFGVWDTYTFQGSQSRMISNEQSTISNRTQIVVEENTYQRAIKLKVSGIDVRWLTYFQELILSKEIYLLENGKHLLHAGANNLTYLDSSKYTENMELDFYFSAKDNSY
jgi:hypothetical protein